MRQEQHPLADTVEAMNDNWWHSLLVRSGDEGLNTTMCGFVTAVPLMILGPQHEDQDWRGGIPAWGHGLPDAWMSYIREHGGTGLGVT